MHSQASKTITAILCTPNQKAIPQHLTSFIQASQAQLSPSRSSITHRISNEMQPLQPRNEYLVLPICAIIAYAGRQKKKNVLW